MRAIVLVRRDVREVDQIISLYTEEVGKRELLARGVKKMVSKNSPHLEPCTLVNLGMAEGKEIDHLLKAQPIEFFSPIRLDFRKSILAFFVVNTVDRTTHANEPDARIFELLLTWLYFLRDTKEEQTIFVDSFVLVLMSYLGFTPQLAHCTVCGKEEKEMGSAMLFSLKTGGIVCIAHEAERRRENDQLFRLNAEGLQLLKTLLEGNFEQLEQEMYSQEISASVHRIVYFFFSYHSEREVSDWGKLIVA